MEVKTSKELYQWDLDCTVEITLNESEVIDEVHFEDKYSTAAMVMQIASVDDGIVVNIPNILLQRVHPIKMYVVKSDQTQSAHTFRVIPRQKPSDYIYTETEVLTYRALEDRIKALEESGEVSDEAVKSAVEGYLEKNPIDIPDTLPNPNKLTIKQGDTEISYDGSGAVTITLPEVGTKRVEEASTDTDVELSPNKLYVFPEMETLNITLAEPTDSSVVNEYHFIFQSGATATTFSIPDAVKVPSSFSIEANKVYEISILENCLAYQSWEVG